MNFYPFQENLISFFDDKNRGVLAADAGLGKTRVILKVLENKKLIGTRGKKVLVIVPASLRINFSNEILKWGYDLNHFKIVSYNWVVSNSKDLGWLKGISAVVLDEIQDNIRNHKSKRTLAIGRISNWVQHLYFLSGTPVKKSSLDIWPTFYMCEGKQKWGNYFQFADKYCYKVYNSFKRGYEFTGFRNPTELKEKSKSVMIRCKKKDVLHELPELIENELYLEKEKLSVTEDLKHLEDVISAGSNNEHISFVRQITAFAKIPGYIESLETRGINRGIIFVWHKTVGEEISKKLSCPFLSGDVVADKRIDIVNDFQNEKINWVVCSIAACGTGFNMQNCGYVGFLEMPFTYAEVEQSYSRVFRIGNRGCYVEYVLMQDSIDIPIHRIVMRRKSDVRRMVG